MAIYRHDMSIFTYGPETTPGTAVPANIKYIPGAYESITAPDPVTEFNMRYFLNQNNDRNWTYMYRGRETLQGSAPNIILLDGTPLVYILGAAKHKSVVAAASDVDTTPEDESLAHNKHLIYEAAIPPSMSWDIQLRDSDNVGANDFARRYLGGVVNRSTISANEGELLRMSWDDVLFRNMLHNQSSQSNVTSNLSRFNLLTNRASAPNSGRTTNPIAINYPEGEPYYFSQGLVKFFGITFARIRSFRIEVNNNVEPRYYIRSYDSNASVGGARGPSEFQAQNREITMSVTMAMEDTLLATATTRTLWKEFILQGNYQQATDSPLLEGFDIELTFKKGTNDSIDIVSPYIGSSSSDLDDADTLAEVKHTPTGNFGGQGCFFRRVSHNIGTESPIQVDGEVIMRNIAFLVTDGKSDSDYPIDNGDLN